MMYRQGDVLLRKIDKIPTGAKKKNNTVALGEVTGHHHTFDGGAQVFEMVGQQFVDIPKSSTLIHQEHAPITFPPGKYAVILQREFDVVEGVRQVLD